MKALTRILVNMVTLGLENVIHRYYSSYRGYVAEREDPEGYGRLKLIIPITTGENVMNYWAWQKDCYSGANHGMQNIPEVGDMVWVEFEHGDPNKPIWSYGYFAKRSGKKEKPDTLKSVFIKWFKTPAGHLIELDDTEGEEEIRITQAHGGKFTISKDGFTFYTNKNIDVVAGDNSLHLDDSGIHLNSGVKPVFINGSYPVLYAKVPLATAITDVEEIGVATKLKVG